MGSRAGVSQAGRIEGRILLIRGEKVIIDADLAEFYGVTTKRLNEQMKRNRRRFPKDFAFRLTRSETREVVAKCDHLSRLRFSSSLPSAFTEHGALMAASVLNTSRAVDVSVFVVRAFVRLRQALGATPELAKRLDQLDGRLGHQDRQITTIIQALRELASTTPVPSHRRIGFR